MTPNASPSTASPAEVYDRRFVPALFGPWGPRLCALAGVGSGDAVLDVACGTGALTVAVAQRVGPDGRAVGLDPNPEMLAVARAKDVAVEWKDGRAEEIPFPDGAFDHVLSQFGFMFFEDPVGALREMQRVLRRGGHLVVAVCDALDHSPGYAVLTELLHRLFGASVADAFRAPFALGDRWRMRELADLAGLGNAEIRRLDADVRFDSIADLVATERACAWTLGGLLDDDQFERLLDEARESLAPFAEPDGAVRFGMPALCLTATRAAESCRAEDLAPGPGSSTAGSSRSTRCSPTTGSTTRREIFPSGDGAGWEDAPRRRRREVPRRVRAAPAFEIYDDEEAALENWS